MAHKNKVSFLQIADYEIEKEKPNGSQMAHGKRVTLVSLSFFYVCRTNEAKRGLMRTPVSKSLNILYFILTFTSENLITH